MRKKQGRPSLFQPATIRKILRSAERGLPLVHCAASAGITYMTLTKYRAEHTEFADALSKAVSKGVEARLKVVEDALTSPDENIRLRSAFWFLEHTCPYFSRQRIELTGVDGAPLAGLVAVYLPQKDGDGNGSPLVTAPRKEIANGN